MHNTICNGVIIQSTALTIVKLLCSTSRHEQNACSKYSTQLVPRLLGGGGGGGVILYT